MHRGFLVNPVFRCASSHMLTSKTQHENLSEEHKGPLDISDTDTGEVSQCKTSNAVFCLQVGSSRALKG